MSPPIPVRGVSRATGAGQGQHSCRGGLATSFLKRKGSGSRRVRRHCRALESCWRRGASDNPGRQKVETVGGASRSAQKEKEPSRLELLNDGNAAEQQLNSHVRVVAHRRAEQADAAPCRRNLKSQNWIRASGSTNCAAW